MGKATTSFYALPHEQVLWLSVLLEDPKAWCIADFIFENRLSVVTPSKVKELPFAGNPFVFRLFIGHDDISPSLMSESADVSDLNLVRSGAVHVQPSIESDSLLLEGSIGILRKRQYQQSTIPYRDIYKWKLLVSGLLRRLVAHPAASLTSNGATYADDIILSRGAVERSAAGVQLKQFKESTVAFQIRVQG